MDRRKCSLKAGLICFILSVSLVIVAPIILDGQRSLAAGTDDWMQKVDLNKKVFEEANQLTWEDMQDPLVIVSKRNKVPANYVPPQLVSINQKVTVTPETKAAFDKMWAAAAQSGCKVNATSGFRSVAYQSSLYNRYLKTDNLKSVETYSARPGYSEHHTGLALDVVGANGSMIGFGATKDSRWVNENAHNYGFIVRYLPDMMYITGYKSEPWHIRYVGVDVATEMKVGGFKSLEEYVGKVVKADPAKIYFNGKELALNKKPILKKSRNLVPVRDIFEALGAEISWENSTKTIKAIAPNLEISMQIGSNTMKVNGTQVNIDTPPVLVKGTSYVPLRAVSESFNANVEWKGSENSVYITI